MNETLRSDAGPGAHRFLLEWGPRASWTVGIVVAVAAAWALSRARALLAVPLVAVTVAVRLANVPDPERSYFALAMLR